MGIFDFTDYKLFINTYFSTLPKKGHGQYRKLSILLNVSSVVVSQVLKGSRHFTLEQALEISKFLGLSENETEYFLLMISKERAGTQQLVKYYTNQMHQMRKDNESVKNKIVTHSELSDLEKSIFYSNWYYSGIRLLSSIDGYNDVDSIANYFGLSKQKVRKIIDFLLQTQLCKEEGNKVTMNMKTTYIAPESPFINSHRRNWRLKAMERLNESTEDELFFSSPYSLGKKDISKIKKEILSLIQNTSKVVADSPCEEVACLNIDWFKF